MESSTASDSRGRLGLSNPPGRASARIVLVPAAGPAGQRIPDLDHDLLILLSTDGAGERSQRLLPSQLAQGPGTGPPHQRRTIAAQGSGQGRDRRALSGVTEGYRRVPSQTLAAAPVNGGGAEPGPERRFG